MNNGKGLGSAKNRAHSRAHGIGALAEPGAIVAGNTEAIIGKTLDGIITSWNASAERLYGYSAADAIGRSIELIVPPERAPELRRILEVIGRGEGVVPVETERITKDGKRLTISLALSPIFDRGGRIVGASSISHDITALRQAERQVTALLQAAERLNATAEPDEVLRQVVAIGVELVRAGRGSIVTNEGDHALRRYSWSGGSWQAEHDRISLEGSASGWVIAHRQAYRHSQTAGEPYLFAGAGLGPRPNDWLSVPVTARDGSVLGVLHLFDRLDGLPFSDEDLRLATGIAHHAAVALERANLDAELRQAGEEQRQGERLRLAGELTAGLAHDLNNVLSIAVGRTDVLMELDRQEERLAPRTRESLTVVRTALLDAVNTVRRLQSFARGRATEPLAPVRLDQLALEAIEMARPRWEQQAQAEGRAIQVNTQIPGPIIIDGYAGEIREAVLNLVINAVDALPAGGTISIGISPEDRSVALAVSDTGTGIPRHLVQQVWEPFFTTKGDRGSGLGLAMVRRILDRQGGSATLDSEPGRGTRVTLRFPIASLQTPREPAASASRQAPPMHVLIVDDEPRVRETLASMLMLLGHQVFEAQSAESAMAAIANSRVDLVLTDHGMPGTTGLDLARRINNRDAAPPVVLLTGWGQTISAELVEAAGARLANKPLSLDLLREILRWAHLINSQHQ